MKLFIKYIAEHKKLLIAFVFFAAVFAASFALYHLPFGAVVYAARLCLGSGGVFVAYDFFKIKIRHKTLCEIQKLNAEMIDDLPSPKTIVEEDYQAIIRGILSEFSETTVRSLAEYRDMEEYYTVWVHQIKTPITSMRLSLENEDTALSRKLSSDLFQIEQYVEMVMAFLRLDSKTSDYLFKEYPLDGIIKQTVSKFASEFIDRRIRLDYIPTEESAVTDEKWLSFIVGQLLSNALKYTKNGVIKIYVKEPKTLCIEDMGIGIDPRDLPRVFEKGYTGGNGRTDKRASGIGLYLCKRICKRLNIGISITSELDKGTTVSLDLKQYELKAE